MTTEPKIRAEAGPKSPALRPYRILRDYWDEAGARQRAGTIVEMTAEEAMDGVESGALARVK